MLDKEFNFETDDEKYAVKQIPEDETMGDDDPSTDLYEVTRESDGETRKVFFNSDTSNEDFANFVEKEAVSIFRPIFVEPEDDDL